MADVKIDLNNPVFQQDFFGLEKEEQLALIKTLKKISKISKMSWSAIYSDHGLKWELITSKTAPSGKRIYSFRFSQKFRATALRDEDFLHILTLHVDHDGAYKP